MYQSAILLVKNWWFGHAKFTILYKNRASWYFGCGMSPSTWKDESCTPLPSFLTTIKFAPGSLVSTPSPRSIEVESFQYQYMFQFGYFEFTLWPMWMMQVKILYPSILSSLIIYSFRWGQNGEGVYTSRNSTSRGCEFPTSQLAS